MTVYEISLNFTCQNVFDIEAAAVINIYKYSVKTVF